MTYQEHFDSRGHTYDKAMTSYPHARRSEFRQAIEAAKITSNMTVADVPAGGGYLKKYLPEECQYISHEPCGSFTSHGTNPEQSLSLLPLPWPNGSVDVAISLAGVHHLKDKRPFFSELHRVVKSHGLLVVSDVAAHSKEACFLDGYVGLHNSTGHNGYFLDRYTIDELTQTGWLVDHAKTHDFYWEFATRADLTSFSHGLFDLRTSSQTDTLRAIETTLGIENLPNGGVGMCWSLMTVVALRK